MPDESNLLKKWCDNNLREIEYVIQNQNKSYYNDIKAGLI